MNDDQACIMGREIIHLKQTDSTNNEATYLITKKDPIEGTVIVADFQTDGRGQFDRTWQSERGVNLMLSVIIKPHFLHPTRQFYLNIMASLAVSKTLLTSCGLPTLVKWPNDVYSGEYKIAGILIQNFLTGKVIRHTIIGMGININQEVFPPDLSKASSVFLQTGQRRDLAEVMGGLLMNLDRSYERLKRQPEELKKSYLENLLGFGEKRKFEAGERRFDGTISGIDDYGRLLIRSAHGLEAFDNNSISMCT